MSGLHEHSQEQAAPPPHGRYDVMQLVDLVFGALTERQRAVLSWTATAATNEEIARKIGYSQKTVEAELTATYAALGVQSRIEAAVIWTLVAVKTDDRIE